jgi:hypothetical protein
LDHIVKGTDLPELRVTSDRHPHGLTLLEALSRVDLEVGEISESVEEHSKKHTFLSEIEIPDTDGSEEDENKNNSEEDGGEEGDEQES